jgi:hypothetical protein
MTKGEKVVKKAFEYLGVREVPYGSNRGKDIDRWEARWGMQGEPWCGMFSDAMFAEAGVDDSGINHPSTAVICQKGKKYKWNGKGTIPPGSLWVNCGIHVAIVTAHNSDGTVSTIEGNKNNMVATGRRPIAGATIIVPPSVDDYVPGTVEKKYWLEDLGAEQKLLTVNGKIARWSKKQYRDKVLNQIKDSPLYRGTTLAPVSRGEGRNKRYFIRVGDLRYYGPWDKIEYRNAAQKSLEKRIGRRLRRFSKTVN